MKFNSQILFSVFVWSLLVIRYGYRFGTGDHVEYLPYVLYLNDHSLFPYDYFLQGLAQKVPNERSVVCNFLSLFGTQLETVCFILHFLVTVTLITGLQKLGKVVTTNISVTRIAILINFFLLFDRGLGNVELYSDAVQGSCISVALISFGLYYFFTNRFILASALMSIASIIHPVEGLTVFMVMSATLFYITLFEKTVPKKQFLQFVLLYGCTAGVFIAILLAKKFDGTSIPGSALFFSIYHEFRHAHHYVFAYLPLIEKCLFVFFIGVIFFKTLKVNSKLFLFTVFTLLGTTFCILCTDVLHSPQIANLQFYKVSQWIKFFGVLTVIELLHESVAANTINSFNKYFGVRVTFIALIGAIIVLVIKPSFIERPGIYHQYGSNWKKENDMVEMSIQINTNVGKNAVFIQPFECTELKYFGRVSSWVDWKAFVKDESKIEEWYRRIGVLYGITIQDGEKGFALSTKANEHFYHLNTQQIKLLKHEGVTHLLTRKEFPAAYGNLVLSNKRYAVYQL